LINIRKIESKQQNKIFIAESLAAAGFFEFLAK
jgi:hypothetical protein